jgi:hypothetical protein
MSRAGFNSEEPTGPFPGAATVNADNPWPGLLSFREIDQEYFEGRRRETEELYRLVMRERLTLFFGLSGLGKSSLLQAGLFPLLRKESILPVYVRLDFSAAAPDLIAQVKAAVVRQSELANIEAPPINPAETLWEYFHRQGNEFWTSRNRPVVPLIAFDQFEETFTLGRLDVQRAKATERFFEQVADLIEGRPPAALKLWLDEHPEEARNFTFNRHYYKVLLSAREDFLPELEVLRARIPSIAVNRFRLQRMNGSAALRVVARPKHLIDLNIAERVVRFVAAGHSGAALENLEVEPALLSVVCRELNNKRQHLKESKITETLLEGNRDQVLNDFYERTVGDLSPEARNFVEERLLTVSGFRDSVALENALSIPGVTADCINQLTERRLLRREDRGGVQRVELTHDLLTGVVRASRDRRRQQEEAVKAQLALQQAQERERVLLEQQREKEKQERARRELARTRKVAAILALLALVALAATIGVIKSRSELQRASLQEQQARQEAVAQAASADRQRSIAEDAVNRIQQSLLIRQAALSGDYAKLDQLVAQLDSNDKLQFNATATFLYKSGRDDIYRFDLFPRRETLPSGQDGVAFITYLADHPTFRNTLLTAGQKREFRASYDGWGCLDRIVALTEYVDPAKPPTVSMFDMCMLLGGPWYRRR